MRLLKALFTLIFCVIFSANSFSQQTNDDFHKIEILEVIQVKTYTYLRVKEVDDEKWMAVPSTTVNVGDIYYYKGGMEMPNFKSNELKRTFKSVIFLGSISKSQTGNDKVSYSHNDIGKNNLKNSIKDRPINIEHSKGVISISELLKEKKNLVGKKVKIKGKVMKFNSQIMSKNWVHLQDGTDFNGKIDVTITTSEVANLGDVLIFEGLVSIDKDFGYGYFYDLIIENAVILNQ